MIKHKRIPFKIFFFLFSIILFLFWIKKSLLLSQLNNSIYFINQSFSAIQNNSEQFSFASDNDDYSRVFFNGDVSFHNIQFDKGHGQFKLADYLFNKTNGWKTSFFHTKSKNISLYYNDLSFNNYPNCKPYISFYTDNNKNNKHIIYQISPLFSFSIMPSRYIRPVSGILINGDMESWDSPSDSFQKMNEHIKNYSQFFESSDSARTPSNAYYYNDPSLTHLLPQYNCVSDNPISGMFSTELSFENGICSLFFSQLFYSGKYTFSFYVRGKNNTEIGIFYVPVLDNKFCPPVYIGTTKIHGQSTFFVSSSFSASFPKQSDFFELGIYVRNGSASLDNFCLIKENSI